MQSQKSQIAQLLNLAQHQLQTHNYPTSIKILHQVLQLAPTNDEAYRLLGDCYDQLGEKDEAERCYLMGIDCNPLATACYGNYGVMLFGEGRVVEAEEMCQVGIGISPGNVDLLNNYMVLLYEIGKYEKAQKIIQMCLAVDPNNINCKQYLSKIQQSRSQNPPKQPLSPKSSPQSPSLSSPSLSSLSHSQLLTLLTQTTHTNTQNLQKISALTSELSQKTNQLNQLRKQLQQYKRKQVQEENMRLCKICMNKTAMFVNKKCGHLLVCKGCLGVVGRRCPICRETGSYIRVYSSMIREEYY